jgi:hypothetical protein
MSAEKAPLLYDAKASQTWKVELPTEKGTISGTITFKPFTNEFWEEYNAPPEDVSDDELQNVQKGLTRDVELWNKLQPKGDFGIENWEDYFDLEEKQDLLRRISFARIKSVKRIGEGKTEIQTECYFAGKPCSQIYILRAKTIEDSSKCRLLESKKYNEKGQPVNQDKEKAEILTDLFVGFPTGFVGADIPGRITTLVFDNFFTSKLGKK